MRVHWRINFVLHIPRPPGTIGTGWINEPHRKLIEIFQPAGDGLTGSKCHRDFGFRVSGKQHLLFEFEAAVTRCDSGKIPGWRVAGCASSRAVEVLLPSFDVSGLEIGRIYPLASPFSSESVVLLSVDKGHQAGNLLLRKVKAAHALRGTAIAHHRADLVSVDILSHELGSREIRPAFSAASVTAVTKGAILPEQGPSALHQSQWVRYRYGRAVWFDIACGWCALSWRLCQRNGEAHHQTSRHS